MAAVYCLQRHLDFGTVGVTCHPQSGDSSPIFSLSKHDSRGTHSPRGHVAFQWNDRNQCRTHDVSLRLRAHLLANIAGGMSVT
jgi:hypothetical protein